MADVAERIASLSPEKRKALELLLKGTQVKSVAVAEPQVEEPADDDGEIQLLDEYSAAPEEVKKNYKRFYDRVTRQLNASDYGQFSFFLNYGYVSDGSLEFSPVELPPQFINKTSVKLVLEVVGDTDLKDRRVLDVGCGRGGTIFVLKTFFNPKELVGLDLSSSAIEFDRKNHRDPRIRFYEGDAEKLPFEDGSFDLVTNVESSHSYPSIHTFYSEVYRVLAPGGYFLYTDLLPVQKMEHCRGLLQHLGFIVERVRDITRNVILSCDEVANQRVSAFHSSNNQALMGNFLATPGSIVYENMRNRVWTYQILKLRKPESGG
jgi:ubiquinone/menaquinone biosynthesis C-methylase UbiE